MDRPENSHRFLAGGDEMGALIRAHDWDATPLGAPATWLHVEGDLARIVQSLVNLLTNASKYSHTGGRVHVATATRKQSGAGQRPSTVCLRNVPGGLGIWHDFPDKLPE